MDMPDIEAYEIKEWETEPGDVIAFNFKTIHAANANLEKKMSRTLSFRLLGDDVVYNERPGRTSPSFPGYKSTKWRALSERTGFLLSADNNINGYCKLDNRDSCVFILCWMNSWLS